MWTKVVGVGLATLVAIKGVTPPNPIQPRDPQAARVVNEGPVAAIFVRWGWLLAIFLYALAFLAYVTIMWLQETYPHTGPSTPARFAEWYVRDVVGLALVLAGGALRLWCYRTLARHFTFSVTIHRDHELVESGPYALLLHPSYTGALLLQAGYAVLMLWDRLWDFQPWPICLLRFDAAMLLLALLSVLFIGKRVLEEEKALHDHFKKKWEVYASKRKRFIPFLF